MLPQCQFTQVSFRQIFGGKIVRIFPAPPRLMNLSNELDKVFSIGLLVASSQANRFLKELQRLSMLACAHEFQLKTCEERILLIVAPLLRYQPRATKSLPSSFGKRARKIWMLRLSS